MRPALFYYYIDFEPFLAKLADALCSERSDFNVVPVRVRGNGPPDDAGVAEKVNATLKREEGKPKRLPGSSAKARGCGCMVATIPVGHRRLLQWVAREARFQADASHSIEKVPFMRGPEGPASREFQTRSWDIGSARSHGARLGRTGFMSQQALCARVHRPNLAGSIDTSPWDERERRRFCGQYSGHPFHGPVTRRVHHFPRLLARADQHRRESR